MQLRHWQTGSLQRIYLQDVPGVGGKAYVNWSYGKLTLVAEQKHEDESTILMVLARHVDLTWPCDPKTLFDALKESALASAGQRKPRGSGVPLSPASHAQGPSPYGGKAVGTDLAFGNIRNAEPVLIEVDHREPPAIDQLLAQVENLTVERKHLSIGDFRINGRIVVERKSVLDFAQSVQSSHIFDQAQRMTIDPETIGMVLIEGDVFRAHTGMLASAVSGAITCLSFVQRLSVINTLGLEHTSYVLAKIAQHDRNGLGYNLPLHKDKPTALIDSQRYILETFNGVSSGVADTLLKHYGTLQAVFEASEESLRKVKGIGPKTATRIREVLTTQYPA